MHFTIESLSEADVQKMIDNGDITVIDNRKNILTVSREDADQIIARQYQLQLNGFFLVPAESDTETQALPVVFSLNKTGAIAILQLIANS